METDCPNLVTLEGSIYGGIFAFNHGGVSNALLRS